MDHTVLFAVLTFALIIGIILLSDSLTTAILIVSLLTNFFIINDHFARMRERQTRLDLTAAGASDMHDDFVPDDGQSTPAPEATPEVTSEYDKWRLAYNNIGGDITAAPLGGSIDAKNVRLSQRRARDKQCSIGWATKDANYYKMHFANELDGNEAKIWWNAE